MTTETDKDGDDEILATALKRYEEAHEEWSPFYEKISADIDFMLGKGHWDDKREYEPDKLKLVINKCLSEVDAIVNEMRASRPSIDTSPADDGADVETSEILDGLIRNTQNVSNASTAYDTAALPQVAGGLGFARVDLRWIPGTFDQEARIVAVEDFTSVLMDKMTMALDGSDMRYGFVIREDMTEDEFKKQYPDATLVDFKNDKSGWCKEGHVRIAEYFYKETVTEKLHQLADGKVIRDKDLQGLPGRDALNIVRSREEEVSLVKWCKINGQEILEKTDWLGKYIPLIPFYGRLVFNNGVRNISGLIDVLRDPQKMLNYWESSHTEVIALQPKAPLTGYDEVIEGYDEIYKNANTKNYPLLPGKAVVKNGVLLPLPMRQPPPQPSLGMLQQSQMALQHIKAVTGKVYDEGQKTLGSESGKALLAKERKTEVSNYHYIDNQAKSIQHIGVILVDLYQKIMSGPRIARILGNDDEEDKVPLNQPFARVNGKRVPVKPGMKAEGIYRLDAGKYDVTVRVGPSYSSRRQEFTESMLQLATALPQVMSVCADVIVRHMDFPGAREIADRLKKTLPPGIANDEQSPEQAALAQATQAIELLKGKMAQMDQQLQDKTRSEDQKHQIDMINANLKQEEINIKKFEASIKAMTAQAAANERMQPQDFAKIIQFITSLDERMSDMTSAFELLLDADEGDPSQPAQPATQI